MCGLDQQCCYHGRGDYLSERKNLSVKAKKDSMKKIGCDCSSCYASFRKTLGRELEQKFFGAVLKTIEENQIIALRPDKIQKDLKAVLNKALKIVGKA